MPPKAAGKPKTRPKAKTKPKAKGPPGDSQPLLKPEVIGAPQENGTGGPDGKGAPKKPEKKAGKKAKVTPVEEVEKKEKVRTREPQSWEEDSFPAREERELVQFAPDPKAYAAPKKRLHKAKEDPATFRRRWKLHFAVTGIQNSTGRDWEIFLAAQQSSVQKAKSTNRLHAKFCYTHSFEIAVGKKKVLKTMEVMFNKDVDYSYKELMHQEVTLDVWMVSRHNFNKIIGSAQKSLYAMANESVFQMMSVKPTAMPQVKAKDAVDIQVGVIYVNAVVQELMEFKIVANNWQFQPRPQDRGRAPKAIKIEMPRGPNQGGDVFQTAPCPGPRYSWAAAGEFTYKGTKVGLEMEAMKITLFSGESLQGKAILSLGGVGDLPIAHGTIKAMTENTEHFVQGKVGGSLNMTSKSLLLKPTDVDEESSIPPPHQLASSQTLFHLVPTMQYLVVEMQSADGLPIADPDYGSSNPFVRVKFDNLMMQSPVVEGSVSPTWMHTFYLPVRVTDEQLRSNARFAQRLLPLEMRSKGYLEIEVWHMDSVPTEFLGCCRLDMNKTRIQFKEARKCISATKAKSATAKGAGGDEDDEDNVGISPALAKKHLTRVYEGRREGLTGSWLQSVTRATVSFDCYFLPDFPPDFKYLPQDTVQGENVFEKCFKQWDADWASFREAYLAWFPDAPATRRFLGHYQAADGGHEPLPKLITPLALPASLAEPIQVQHWVLCTEFSAPPRQRSMGEINIWQGPEDILAARRGSVQDHAVLLCCALQGLGKSAFVCKGTVQGGKEHTWVMTREALGTVTFWETTTAAKFHLRGRWTGDNSHGDQCKKLVMDRWKARKANSKWRESAEARSKMTRQEHLAAMDELAKLDISPWTQLCAQDSVVAIPYESVEVVFTSRQLWGNQGNHHPAAIFYDMEDDPRSWKPMVPEDLLVSLLQGKAIAIPIGPTVSKFTAESMENVIEAEIKESCRMMRMRKGQETDFKEDEALQETIERYLGHLERECCLDSDWCYDSSDKLRQPWGGPPPADFARQQRCREEWSHHWKTKKALLDARKFLPVRENCILSGVPMHFSTFDIKEIRKNLVNARVFQEYLMIEADEAQFFVCAKVFPLPGTVSSVWIFVGAEVPLEEEQILKISQDNMKKLLESNPEDEAAEAAEAEDPWGKDPEKGEEKDEAAGKDKPEEKKKKKKKKGDWFVDQE